MNILTVTMTIFILLEISNVLTLYFKPGVKVGNGIGVFNAYEQSKKYPEIHELIKYLIYWVAGTKLIFIALIVVIIFTGTPTTQLYAVVTLILSILSFYWRLMPIIKEMDKRNQITPKGYAKGLSMIIAGFVMMFIVALIWYL